MSELTSVEVCAGAGGQAIGLEGSGFHHLACVEWEEAACETLRTNRPQWNVVQSDLRDWVPDADIGQVDLLAGGVPCPPFSIAGLGLGRDDERDLFPEMIRLAGELSPRALMIENVRGLLATKFADYRDEIVRELKELGYEFCGWELLNAADFGVPQARLRSVLVMMRPDAAFHFRWPEPNGQRTTVAEALVGFMGGWSGADAWSERANSVAPALVGGSKRHGGPILGLPVLEPAGPSLELMGEASRILNQRMRTCTRGFLGSPSRWLPPSRVFLLTGKYLGARPLRIVKSGMHSRHQLLLRYPARSHWHFGPRKPKQALLDRRD